MNYEQILFSTEGAIAYLTLNQPQKINSLSSKMISEMIEALTAVSTDESVKVVIIRGAGKHFCAGHDMSEMVGEGAKEAKQIFERCGRLMALLHAIPQPVIAQVQGVATAAGCQLVSWCDLVVAEEGARFATPGVKIGLFCTTPAVAISRAIGRKAAMEMLLTGRYFPADEAKALGLVNRVVPLEQLSAETEQLALQIAEASRYVLGIGKQGFYAQVDATDEKAFQVATQTIALNMLAEDAQSGVSAFIEKKTPEWKNR